MKKRNLFLALFLVLVLSLALFAVACDNKPSETTADTTAESTESGSTNNTTTESSPSDTTGTEGGNNANLPEAGSTLTIKQILELDDLFDNKEYTEGKYYVKGTVKTIFNKKQGNMVISDSEGNTLTLYATYNEDGTVAYGDMTEKPAVGDAVVVYGVIGFANSSMQMKDGWIVAFGDAATETTNSSSDSETTEPPTGNQTTEAPTDGETTAESIDIGSLDIPKDPYEETEGATEEETLDPDACPDHPNGFAYDSGYHWYPACEKCGRDTATKPMAHTGYGIIEDEGDILLYSYFCRWCNCTISRIEVPYDVNLYMDSVYISELKNGTDHNYGTTAGKIDSVDGFPSAKFTAQTGSGNFVTIYSNDSTASPTGQWVVMKLKLGNGRSSFSLGVSSIQGKRGTSAAKGTDGIVNATFTGLPSGWVTVIADLSKIVNGDAGYQPDDNGNYYLSRFKFMMNGASALSIGESFNLAYVAFFDTVEDAKDFASGENARYIYNDVMAGDHRPDEIDGTPCVHEYSQPDVLHHEYAACDVCGDEGGVIEHKYNFINVETFEDGRISQYQVECICGMKSALKTVPEDVNYYTVPSKIHITNAWSGYTHGTVGFEDGDVYQRVYLAGNPANGHGGTVPMITTGDLSKFDTVQNGSGKYFLLKVRAHNIQVIALRLATRADGDLLTLPADGHPNSHSWTDYADEWVTVVVDLRRLAATGVPSQVSPYIVDDDDIKQVSVGLQCQKTGGEEVEGYLDIAYFAICDTWDQIAEITGKEKVLVTSWAGNAAFAEATTDGNIQCEDHVPKLYMSEDRKTYSYRCMICDKHYETRTFTKDINFYSAPGQQTNSWNTGGLDSRYATPGKLMFDEDGGFIYNHITLEKGGAFEFINGSTAKEVFIKGFNPVHDTIYGGTGKYMLLKMRVGSEEQVSLLAWDGVTGKELYFDDTISEEAKKLKSDTIFGLTTRKTALNADWTVYVIDLDVFAATYDAENLDITNVTFGLKGDYTEAASDTECVDIAYMAIVDGWGEVEDIVGADEIVLYTDWKTPFNDEIRKTDGTVTALPECETHAEIVMDSVKNGNVTTYRYSCPVCRKIFENKTVSDDINYYAAPSTKMAFNNWNTGKATSNAWYVGNVNIYSDNGASFPYTRVSIQDGGSFELLNGSYAVTWEQKGFDTAHDKINGGSGNFIVIKMRVGEGAKEYLKMVAWDGKTGTASLSSSVSRNALSTEWVVYVIDISKAFSNTYTAGKADVTNATFGFQGDGNGGKYENSAWVGYDENDYVDIAYFAVCDGWDDIEAVVGNENVILTDWKTPANDKNYTSDGTEITIPACETHATVEYAKIVDGTTTTYKYVCPECTHVVDERTISGDINYYVAPNAAAAFNNWACGTDSSKYSYGVNVGVLKQYKGTNSESFMYAEVIMNGGASFELNNGTGSPSYKWIGDAVNTINGGAGKYAVIKFRLGSGMNGIRFMAWDGVTGSCYEPNKHKKFTNDTWHVVVIDLSAFSASYDTTGTATVEKVMFGFKNDIGSGDGVEKNMRMDIAYFAVCDNWTEIASVVGTGDTTALLTGWVSGTDSTVTIADMVAAENQ